jgi:hypothetical protein
MRHRQQRKCARGIFRLAPPAFLWVEYDTTGGRRVARRFADPQEAQRFYVLKANARKRPKVVRVAL